MSRGRRQYRTGMTRDGIVDAARELTREHGLDGWSLRDLAARLDTSLSVIYHHVGDRDQVSAAVVARVWTLVDAPIDETDWRRWFYGVLAPLHDHLRQYPGVAGWFLRKGPRLDMLMPVVEAGMSRMLDAGFGDEAATAYSMVFNTCLGLIDIVDHRARDDTDPNLADLAHLLESTPTAGPGTKRLQQLVTRFAAGAPADREQARRDNYLYTLERTLDGLEARLRQLNATER